MADASASSTSVRRPGPRQSAYAELSRQVRGVGLLQRRYSYYWVRIVGAVASFAAVWIAFTYVGDSWYQLLVAASLAVVLTQFGFLGHDAAHRQIFRSAAWNEWTARLLSGIFAGLSHDWWTHKHNRHHGAPNQEDKDPDIASGVIAFTPALAGPRIAGPLGWLTRHQGYLFFPMLLLEGVNLHLAGLSSLIRTPLGGHRRLELLLIVARMVSYTAVVFSCLPAGKASAFLAVQMGLFGLLLGGSFAPNHKGMPIVPRDARVDFLRRQVLMSRNIRGGPFIDFIMGGLNYQIEHHLFPSMPRPNLRLAKPIVEEYCRSQGVTYTQTTLLTSYGIIVRYLNTVGLLASEPQTCPMVLRYRG